MIYEYRSSIVSVRKVDLFNSADIIDWLKYERSGSKEDWEGQSFVVTTPYGNVMASPGKYVTRQILDDGSILSHVFNEEDFYKIFKRKKND